MQLRTARIAMAAAKGLLLAYNPHKLVKYDGNTELKGSFSPQKNGLIPSKPTTPKS